ncbi:MAG: hypothetical protein IPO27_10860 [Bacteroidetes bacterium]|nr:hypothetical protein [Bacteroidota bacterium]
MYKLLPKRPRLRNAIFTPLPIKPLPANEGDVSYHPVNTKLPGRVTSTIVNPSR